MKLVFFLAVILFINFAMADDIFHTDYYKKVVKMYKKDIAKNPKDIERYYKLALAYRALEDYDKAIKIYKKIENKKPTAKVYYNLALSYEKSFKYKESAEYILKALKLDKDNEKYLILLKELSKLLGIEYIRNKEYKEAIDLFNLNLKYNLNDENSYFYLGYIYQKEKRYKKAIEAYKKVLKINNKDDYSHYNLGVIYLKTNKPKMAIKNLAKAIEINPYFGSAYLNLFELSLINNISKNKELEDKFLKYNSKNRRDIAIFEILKILNSINIGKKVNLESWADKYKGISLKGYNFDDIEKWIKKLKDKAKRDRLKKAVEFFKSNTEQKDIS